MPRTQTPRNKLRITPPHGDGRSQGARKRKAIAEANAEKAKVEKECDELREALNTLEDPLGIGTWQYDSEGGTHPSRVKTTTVTRVLQSMSSKKKGARSQEHNIVELDAEESAAERVVRLLAHQAGARASSSPETRKVTRRSPRLSAKSGHSAGSVNVMRSGSQPHNHNLKFDDALVAAPTPE